MVLVPPAATVQRASVPELPVAPPAAGSSSGHERVASGARVQVLVCMAVAAERRAAGAQLALRPMPKEKAARQVVPLPELQLALAVLAPSAFEAALASAKLA